MKTLDAAGEFPHNGLIEKALSMTNQQVGEIVLIGRAGETLVTIVNLGDSPPDHVHTFDHYERPPTCTVCGEVGR